MNLQERIKTRDLALGAQDYDSEQAAFARCAVVDIHPTIIDISPTIQEMAADLYPRWDVHLEMETNADYYAVCKKIGAFYDRGARRYVINRKSAAYATTALHAAGFLVAIHPSLIDNHTGADLLPGAQDEAQPLPRRMYV
jgi:hypothetical protein